jgi:glutaredoxin
MNKIFPDGIRIWFFILLVAMIPFVLNAQKDVQLFEKEKNGNIIIYAKNLSKTDLKIDLRIESTGLNLSNSISHKQVLKGGSTEEVITLTPTPGLAWSYKTSLSYSPVNDDGTWNETKGGKQKNKGLTEARGVVLYTKPGCGRCKQARNYLADEGIPYKEVDLSRRTDDTDAMWSALRAQGFAGESVKTPVIQVNGRLYYEMQNVSDFLDEKIKK